MKSDLRLNFGVLEDIAEKTMKYKESLETVKEVLENVNNKIDENEGKAIDELRKGYKDINEDLDRCLEEVDDIYDIMNRYTDEMQSIITPKKKNDIMRVDRTDIWWNQQSIMEACQSVQFLRWNISTYRSFINPFADDDVVENEENNYNKMKCIWDEINSCGYKLSSYVDEMNRLFNSKIVVFENRDDDYKGEVKSRLYDKYTSGFERFIDVGSDTINFVIDTVRGFSMSIYDMLVGIVNLCKSIICLPGSAVAFVYDKITGEVPDCLKDSYEYEKNFLGGISSVVKDPTLLVEGIAQGVSDAYEEEGIAYCFGYGAGEVAQFVVGSKLASKLKGGKVKSSAFGYMDADDALRYNQYWDDVAKGLYNNPYGGKLSLDEISRMQCGFDKIAQKNWEYELGLDRYNNRILDYHNENAINNAIKCCSSSNVDDVTGIDWYNYFRDTYGKENVCWENCNPSEVASAWQGSYPYTGVDKYSNIKLHDGDIIWMGEPFPTGYSTTPEVVQVIGKDAQKVFKGLQVKPYYENGMSFAEYRSSLTPYKVHGELNVADGIAMNNLQFGAGGLVQRFDPNFDYNCANGFLERLDAQTIELTNTKISLEEYFNMMNEVK